MTSLRKRVTSYFRQLSFHNEPRERKTTINENSFINKYLLGQIKLKEGPPVLYGKNPQDLPNFELDLYTTGATTVVGCSTGPNGGLTSVKRVEKHLSIPDTDIDYIDTQEETGSDVNNANITIDGDSDKQNQWNKKTEYVYGLSDSLYDVNQVTKVRNGNPIADCYGIIARTDSAILALADGVNWGEKASIAAKSAIHGCLHYLNKTIFNDTSLFELEPERNDGTSQRKFNRSGSDYCSRNIDKLTEYTLETSENRISNTSEVFICLLRAFNCAHNLILENEGMLTTLTVAVVLPLKSSSRRKQDDGENEGTHSKSVSYDEEVKDAASNSERTRGVRREKYVCCVCNVGDTLAYIYSQKYGVRELTKGSHDILSNRDMRDALGALGPVDGINPDLSNLTLSVTILEAGDIVMIASDGLTDNYDPSVCKFTENSINVIYSGPSKNDHRSKAAPARETKPSNLKKPPPKYKKPSKQEKPTRPITPKSKRTPQVREPLPKPKETQTSTSKVQNDSLNNPLVAQFMLDNALQDQTSVKINETVDKKQTNDSSHIDNSQNKNNEAKKLIPLAKSNSISTVFKSKVGNEMPQQSMYKMLRSKTSIDMKPKIIPRNEDGLPYVTPIQKYEISLLLIEDILKKGISGIESQCTTARTLCENLLNYTVSITSAKRHMLEDTDIYYHNSNGVLVELSQKEKKIRRRRLLEKLCYLPGKLDHVSVVACNVGNRVIEMHTNS